MITAKYSCKQCGADKIEVSVPTRKEGEDICEFVKETARIVGVHHAHRRCSSTVIDLMIPIANDVIGGGQ